MNYKSKILLFILSISINAAKAAYQDEKFEELLRLSGIKQQMDALPDDIHIQLKESIKVGRAPASFNQAGEHYIQSLKEQKISEKVFQGFKKQLNQKELGELLKWYQSPMAVALTKKEAEGQRPSEKLINDYVFRMQKKNQDPKTRAEFQKHADLVRKIMLLSLANRGGEMLSQSLIQTFALVANNQVPLAQRKSKKAVLKNLELKRPINEQENMDNATLVVLLYTYENVPIKYLERYVAFLKSASAQQMTKELNRQLASVFNHASNYTLEKNGPASN